MNWMFLLSVLLFWLPVAGPLIAGIVGGRKAGSISRAIAAVFLPAVVVAILAFVAAGYWSGAFLWGFVAGLGTFLLLATQVGTLLIGAMVGGLLADAMDR